MRIFDVNNNELKSPSLSRGYLREDRIFVNHHKAIEPVEEQWHYEVIAEYPNGGRDIRKIVDIVGTKGQDAWDEYEDIQRYIEFTEKELEDINKKQEDLSIIEERVARLEEMILELSEHFNFYQSNSENNKQK